MIIVVVQTQTHNSPKQMGTRTSRNQIDMSSGTRKQEIRQQGVHKCNKEFKNEYESTQSKTSQRVYIGDEVVHHIRDLETVRT